MSVVQVFLGRPRDLLPSIFPSISCICDVLCLIRCSRYCSFLVLNFLTIFNYVLFLILLISCCVVAASLMAEKTNVGVAVFVADNTCGFGSDGAAAALLSACTLVRCCSHQFVLRCCFGALLHFVRARTR